MNNDCPICEGQTVEALRAENAALRQRLGNMMRTSVGTVILERDRFRAEASKNRNDTLLWIAECNKQTRIARRLAKKLTIIAKFANAPVPA